LDASILPYERFHAPHNVRMSQFSVNNRSLFGGVLVPWYGSWLTWHIHNGRDILAYYIVIS